MATATPFFAVNSSIHFEDAPEAELPLQAVIWNAHQYSDLNGWVGLPPNHNLELRHTKFSDGRLRFLDPVDGRDPPPEFKDVVSGEYDVKTWRKDQMILSIEGINSVFMRFPGVPNIISWTSPTRLPTYTKSWKPIAFLINSTTIAVRVTDELALILTRSSAGDPSMNVTPIDYNGGFCCVHPCTDEAICYGSYIVPGHTASCLPLPDQPCERGKWGYFVHFFPWGGMVLPKVAMVTGSGGLGAICGAKPNYFCTIFCPPKMFLCLRMTLPSGVHRALAYGVDFAVTAIKTSESDIQIFVVVDGQLIRYNYSFDIRINRPDKPVAMVSVKFKVVLSQEEKQKVAQAKKEKSAYSPRWTFPKTAEQEALITEGCPADVGHMLSRDTVAVFDAENGEYCSHSLGLKMTKAFTALMPVDGGRRAIVPQTASGTTPPTQEQAASGLATGDSLYD